MLTLDAHGTQQALGFLVSQKTHIEAEVYEIQYPDIQYPALIPIDTSANEWAKSVTFFSTSKVGQAQWFHHQAKDMPRADIESAQHEQGIEMAGIGYGYSLEELGQSMMIPGLNLSSDRAAAAVRSYEEFIDGRLLRGDAGKGWTGFINNPTVTRVDAAPNAAGTTTNWSHKSADEMIRDVNDALTGVHISTLTVEMADTVLLSVSAFNLLANTRLGDTQMTALQFLIANNTYTGMTGRPLTIRAVRGLETAGEDGTGRMIVYRRDPQVLKAHLPMPHRFLPVWQTGPIWFDVPGIFRFGGLEIRRPGAVRYIDGIENAPVTGGNGEGEGET